ncbi:putative protein kinase UbiB [Maioricimonas rarisocia]|uniref:Protein kinase domain-containing protein n=1 Tax=Maioricimonas rarisocia TaxID=2528026 RepID=A0A517YZY8_9PLAN|nr:AarF/ABC1/UbiB kinase family protein [Maioricimonas rarisocia]QDU35785.1 putative protein kinase UbiB [Maioricimonas rarisocia]
MEAHPLRFFRNLSRSREIFTVLLNHGFGDLLERLKLRRYVQWGRRVILRKRQPELPEHYTTAQRLRMTLEDLGPTFIKFGQVLSTRPDIVPADVIAELEHLQEGVPPFPSDQAVHRLEVEFQKPLSELFAEFEREPLAAGSLGQVHRARHHDGTLLAVKIRRPNVIRDVERDLALMLDLAILMERHIPESDVFDPVGLVNHFTRTIRREMNFCREARTLQEFAKLFRDDATLTVPFVYDELTCESVLTMQFVGGCRADDDAGIARLGVAPSQLASNGARIFMKMAFELGIFHGDPHPGNLRIQADGSIGLIDYGMVGYLDRAKRDQLVDLFVAIVHQNVDDAVRIVEEMGNPSRPIDDLLLHADVQDFVETYYGVELARLNVGNMLSDFVSILSQHGLRCPADLMLLIRAIVTLEGVGRRIDPQFNLAGELAPYVERLVKRRYDPKRMAARAMADFRELLSAVHDLPIHLGNTLEKLSQDELKVQLEHRSLDRLITEFDRSSNRITVGLVTSSLIVAFALIIRSGSSASTWITVPVFALSGMLGIWLIYGILRSGRL